MPNARISNDSPVPKGRLITGFILVIVGQTFPLYIPLVASSGLSEQWKSALTGIFAFGVPNLFMFVAVAILGNTGFAFLKKKLFGWMAPKDFVGRARYLIGLVLFFVPVAFGWISPYLASSVPEIYEHRIPLSIAGDIMLLAGLFVLGGRFWDKLRSLFVRGAKVVFPA